MADSVDKDSFQQYLTKFPSTFDCDWSNPKVNRVKAIIRKLEDDRGSTRKPEAEYIQISNFLSYLYFLLEDYKHALQCIDESLQKDPDNIIANTNKARILLETGEISEVEDVITKLQELEKKEDYSKRECYARADLAYAYSRLGPWYHQKAVDLYNQVLDAYPEEYPWKFGLGLTLLRQTHRFISQANDKFNPRKDKKTTVQAAELLLTVATESEDPILRANAYARLGKAVFSISKYHYQHVPCSIKRLNHIECFEKAVELCPEEPSVLEICGQFARYRGELGKSEEFLRKSLKIKPTCHAYHHLALTLKRRVESGLEKGESVHRSAGDWHKSTGKWTVPSDKVKHDLRQMMKSPLEVTVFPQNELLIEAKELLEKANELSEYTQILQYDKGLVYRMLGQTAKAVEVFKQIVSKREYLPTKTLLTNVYEQLGLCLLELSKSEEIPPDMLRKYRKDGEVHLLHAVQIQSEIVANDPHFKVAWNSYPTLRDLLSVKSDKKPRQLAELCRLMGDHKDSISIYEELFLKEEGNMKPEDYINMLECYRKDGQYEKCVTLLRSWECTTILSYLPPSLIFDVYIDGAFHAYTTDNVQLAYQHFRRAFQVYGIFHKTNEYQDGDDEDDLKDILILHSCSSGWECKFPGHLGTILKDVTGLQCTINSEDVLPNQLKLTAMASVIQKIPCVIIMTHTNADLCDVSQLRVDQAIEMSSKKSGPHVVVVSDDKDNIPTVARTKPFIKMPSMSEDGLNPNQQIPEEYKKWIKKFIAVLKPTDRS